VDGSWNRLTDFHKFLCIFALFELWSFYAHCVINTNIYVSVSGLNSGNFIQFGDSVIVFYLHSQHHCDYSVTVISSSLARYNIDMQIFFIVFPCVDCFIGNRTTRRQTNSRSVKSRTGQLAEMFYLKFGVYNGSKCYFRQITLFLRCQYSIWLELGLGLGLMYK